MSEQEELGPWAQYWCDLSEVHGQFLDHSNPTPGFLGLIFDVVMGNFPNRALALYHTLAIYACFAMVDVAMFFEGPRRG